MTDARPTGNAEQIRHWNEVAGPLWVEHQDVLDRMIGSFGRRLIDDARLTPGESVLDVGCGTGQTTVEIARRVGPRGRVLGVDVSRPMLEAARRRAAAQNDAATIELREGDAERMTLELAAFDVVTSRFGVMFFADPKAAFTNLRRAIKPTGRLAFLCWQGLARNTWVAGPVQALAQVLPMPAPPPPDAPGPFSFADVARVKGILERAGFRDVAFEDIEDTLQVGDGSVESTVEFLLQIGPCATLLRDAPREAVATARSTLVSYFQGVAREGTVRQRGAAWLVSAQPGA
jgi:SAM-dependent methyltransferase